jgi:competence protein ComEC
LLFLHRPHLLLALVETCAPLLPTEPRCDRRRDGEIAAQPRRRRQGGIPKTSTNAEANRWRTQSDLRLHMALVAATITGDRAAGRLRLLSRFRILPAGQEICGERRAVALRLSLHFGMAVAAERSFIMIGVMLVAALFDRAALTMRNLRLAM